LKTPLLRAKKTVAQPSTEVAEQKQVQAEPKPKLRERDGRQRNKHTNTKYDHQQNNAKKDHRTVVGMGPDLPSFIALSFQERMVES
jgi:hypothetical protein